MKKSLKYVVLILIAGFVLVVAFFVFYREKPYPCGKWSPFDVNEPTCNCDGTIVKKGGPSGPADDSGGYYECVGTILSDFE